MKILQRLYFCIMYICFPFAMLLGLFLGLIAIPFVYILTGKDSFDICNSAIQDYADYVKAYKYKID
jgi:hypothetical protein